MNGSQQSIKTALKVLEIFSNMSGLKVNTEKTKVKGKDIKYNKVIKTSYRLYQSCASLSLYY